MRLAASGRIWRYAVIGAVGMGLALCLALLDPILEGEPPASTREFVADLVEKGLLVGVMIASALVVVRVSRLEEDTTLMRRDLGRAEREGAEWRARSRQLVAGLSGAIERQFDDWRLTRAEADIAGLMLKGASLKDIGALRKTSQATIRQQAQAIYRKSGLANRAEFSAYFLEDLLTVAEAGFSDSAPERSSVARLTPTRASGGGDASLPLSGLSGK